MIEGTNDCLLYDMCFFVTIVLHWLSILYKLQFTEW